MDFAHTHEITSPVSVPVRDETPTLRGSNVKTGKRNVIDFGQSNGTVGVSFQFDRRFLGYVECEIRGGNCVASTPDVDGSVEIAYVAKIGHQETDRVRRYDGRHFEVRPDFSIALVDFRLIGDRHVRNGCVIAVMLDSDLKIGLQRGLVPAGKSGACVGSHKIRDGKPSVEKFSRLKTNIIIRGKKTIFWEINEVDHFKQKFSCKLASYVERFPR